LPLFFAAGKPVLSVVEGMPAGRKAARASRPRIENKARMASPHTACPQTTIRMRLPHNGIDGKWVAASKPALSEVEGPQALGMVANCNFAGAFVHNELGENIDEYF